MRTKAEYLAYRKSWGVEYQRLMQAIREAKLEVRRANSAAAKARSSSSSTLEEHRFKQALENRKGLSKVMRDHIDALREAGAEGRKLYEAKLAAERRHAVAGEARPGRPISDEVMGQLERFKPICIVLRRRDGKLQGLTEESFSMGWEDSRVNLFWSGKAYSMLGEHMLDGMKDALGNARRPDEIVFDALSQECPIDIDWQRWLAATNKYDKRNAHFTEKE